jgi:hypothetical protein
MNAYLYSLIALEIANARARRSSTGWRKPSPVPRRNDHRDCAARSPGSWPQ